MNNTPVVGNNSAISKNIVKNTNNTNNSDTSFEQILRGFTEDNNVEKPEVVVESDTDNEILPVESSFQDKEEQNIKQLDEAMMMKPKDIIFGNLENKNKLTGQQFSSGDAIKLHERIQNGELDSIKGLTFEVPNKEFTTNVSPLISNVRFDVDVEEVDLKKVENYQIFQPVEILSFQASSHPWVIAPSTPLSLSNDWQLNNLQTPEINQQGVMNVSGTIGKSSPMSTFENMSFDSSGNNNIEIGEVKEYQVSHELVKNIFMLQATNVVFENNIVNEKNIEQYEHLSKAITKQVCDIAAKIDIKDNSAIEILLHPKALGAVKIHCRIGESAEITISSEKISTLGLLQQHAQEIKSIFSENLAKSTDVNLQFNMNDSGGNQQKQQYNFSQKNNIGATEKSPLILYFAHDGVVNLIA